MKQMERLSLLLALVLLTYSCKKSDPPGTHVAAASTSASGNGDPSGTYSGFLISLYLPTPTFTFSTGVANFYSTPRSISVNSSGTGNTAVSSVFLNNTKLKLDTAGPNYGDTTYTIVFPPSVWTVNAGGTISSFNYTNSDPMPVFTGTASVPASVDRSQNLTIPINGATGYNQVLVTIDDGGPHPASMAVSSSATSVTFPKDSLANLAAGTANASIYLAFIKYNPQNFSGKNFMFANAYYYTKQGVTIQ